MSWSFWGTVAYCLGAVSGFSAAIERGAGFEHLKLLFSLFLLDVLQDRFVVSAGYDPTKRLFVEFSELVDNFYCEHRQAAFYSRRLVVSVKRLSRLCREEWFAGKNCYGVVMDRILSQAEYLLLGMDIEVKAIGFELGFSSGANFATYFVRYKGLRRYSLGGWAWRTKIKA